MLFNNIINYLKKSILIIYYFSFFCKKIKKFHLIHMKVILEFYDYEKNKLKRKYIKGINVVPFGKGIDKFKLINLFI